MCFQRSLKALSASANLTLHITILLSMAFSPGAGQVWSGVTPLPGYVPERGTKEGGKLQLVQEILGGREGGGGKARNCIGTSIKPIYFCFWNGCGGQWWELPDPLELSRVESIPVFPSQEWKVSIPSMTHFGIKVEWFLNLV